MIVPRKKVISNKKTFKLIVPCQQSKDSRKDVITKQ